MRFVTFDSNGRSRLAVCNDVYMIDISEAFGTIFPDMGAFLRAGMMDRLNEVKTYVASRAASEKLPLPQTFLPPILKPDKIICIGLNYSDHAKEAGMPIPEDMVVFLRVASSLAAHGQSIPLSPLSSALDFEGELAVVIGKRAANLNPEDALDHVFGYSVFNDLSYRDYQLRTSQWTLGKNFDGTGSFGPVVVTRDELPAGGKGLRIVTRVNGTVLQDGTTNNMIFDVARCIAELSSVMTLEPGDVIATGTPAGIGAVQKPPLWLKSGDSCEVEIEHVGLLANRIS